ncbi:transcriptional regulator [Candidatus Magnetomorum sp. HK-1]|nr:transcriptional regulator [Candidatus Magnetomorum sp. HK-1]
MASRAELQEQKKKTSNELILAATQLCAEEGYASLSIRSVARKAGIAPTSFYRHFRDIDELGVAIVDKANIVLEKCMSKAQQKMPEPCVEKISSSEQILQSIEGVVRPFAETFIECIEQNNQLLCLFFQERTGNSEPMRMAISEAIKRLIDALSHELKRISQDFEKKIVETQLIAESMITITSYDAVVMLLNSELDSSEVNEHIIKKLNLLLLGAHTKNK